MSPRSMKEGGVCVCVYVCVCVCINSKTKCQYPHEYETSHTVTSYPDHEDQVYTMEVKA